MKYLYYKFQLIFTIITITTIQIIKTAPSNLIFKHNNKLDNWLCIIISRQTVVAKTTDQFIETNNQIQFGDLSIGSFITENHVLTVAQSIDGYTNWIIGYNLFDTIINDRNNHENIKSHLSNGQFIESNIAIAHPLYNSLKFNYNIGLITIKWKNNPFKDTINYISLAAPQFDETIQRYEEANNDNDNNNNNNNNEDDELISYGILYESNNDQSNEINDVIQLKSIRLKLIENQLCELIWMDNENVSTIECVRETHNLPISTKQHICNNDGDQGSPIIQNHKLIGMISHWQGNNNCNETSSIGFTKFYNNNNTIIIKWLNDQIIVDQR